VDDPELILVERLRQGPVQRMMLRERLTRPFWLAGAAIRAGSGNAP
jgi:hypothetical protein